MIVHQNAFLQRPGWVANQGEDQQQNAPVASRKGETAAWRHTGYFKSLLRLDSPGG